jgi:hypothetical protein
MKKNYIKTISKYTKPKMRSVLVITILIVMIIPCFQPLNANIAKNIQNFKQDSPTIQGDVQSCGCEKSTSTFSNNVRASVTSNGGELIFDMNGNPYGSKEVTISPSGRFVVFMSNALNLSGYTNPVSRNRIKQVYIHDRDLDINGLFDEVGSGKTSTILMSNSTWGNHTGEPANGDCFGSNGGCLDSDAYAGAMKYGISDNGRFVIFTSFATNFYPISLYPGSTPHVYLHDRDYDENGIFDEEYIVGQPLKTNTTLIDKVADGSFGASFRAGHPAISNDGRYIVFRCGDYAARPPYYGIEALYLCDRLNNYSIIRIPLPAIYRSNPWAPSLALNSQGHLFITYLCLYCIPNSNSYNELWLCDYFNGQFSHQLITSKDPGFLNTPSISSSNGNNIAYASFVNNQWDVFIWNRTTNQTTQASVSSGEPGVPGNGNSGSGGEYSMNNGNFGVSISSDGDSVAFVSLASNLINGITHTRFPRVYVHNLKVHTTELASIAANGGEPSWTDSDGNVHIELCLWPSISSCGRYIAFETKADNLLFWWESVDLNNLPDVYIHKKILCTHLGDVNNDGVVNFADINPFVAALSGEIYFYQHHPNGNWDCADCNQDGIVNFADINPFVALLHG